MDVRSCIKQKLFQHLFWDLNQFLCKHLLGPEDCGSQKHACIKTCAEEKYTQMVAQKTLCFCWLAPRPLIIHGVAETFIPSSPISKQSSVSNKRVTNVSISFRFHHLSALGSGRVKSCPPPGLATDHGMFAFFIIEFKVTLW